MKRKLLGALSCLLAVLAFVPASAGAAPATVLSPGVEQAVDENGCAVSVMHGNFGTASFSQFSYTPDFVLPGINQCNEEGTYVVSYALTDPDANGVRSWTEQRCYIDSNTSFPDFGDGACNRWTEGAKMWTQSNKAGSDIVGTQLHLCGDVINCETVDDADFNPRYAAASPTLAHGAQTTLAKDSCSVTFMHGDYVTSAFAQMKYTPGHCDQEESFVEVVSIDGVGNLDRQRCFLDGTTSGSGSCSNWVDAGNPAFRWQQALQPNHHIVGSTVRLCSDNIEDHCDDFYRTGF